MFYHICAWCCLLLTLTNLLLMLLWSCFDSLTLSEFTLVFFFVITVLLFMDLMLNWQYCSFLRNTCVVAYSSCLYYSTVYLSCCHFVAVYFLPYPYAVVYFYCIFIKWCAFVHSFRFQYVFYSFYNIFEYFL